MFIIDSNIHVWSHGTPLPVHRQTAYLPEDALRDMDDAGVGAAIIHPPTWDPESARLALDAAHAHPTRFAIMDQLPSECPDFGALLKHWRVQPGMLGIRFAFFRPEQAALLAAGALEPIWTDAERYGVPAAVFASSHLQAMGDVARAHPGLKLVIDHMGTLAGKKGEEAFANLAQLTALAAYPNVGVKLSAGPAYATDAYPFTSLEPYYRRLYDSFGPGRLFWGTDITRMPCSWRQCVTQMLELSWLSGRDKELIMGEAVAAWLGWPHPAFGADR